MDNQLVLSLFPGIGLLDRAFEAEDFIIVRGPDPLWGGDIRTWHPPAGKFDGIIGGPPCQQFSSLAHLVRANGHEPRFGNLIPEFERCVREALPAWFVMENVPAAPLPAIAGYRAKDFLLDNSALAGEGGFGLEQRRVRRFTFGMRGREEEVPSLLRWIDLCTFLLPGAVFGDGRLTRSEKRREVAAQKRRGCTGTSKARKQRVGPITAGHNNPEALTERKRAKRVKAVSSSNGGNGAERNTPGAGNAGKGRYRLADAIRLQGLPEDFLADAPFTADGKLKAVANGVPLPMGRAIAKAVKEAIAAAPASGG